jgi:uncharacterized protein (DUF427 family)
MTNVRKVLLPGSSHPISIEPTGARVTVRLGGRVVAETHDALTLREASYPPVQYVPLGDVDPDALVPSDHSSYCPFKGKASYYSLRVGDRVAAEAVWTYLRPHDAVSAIEGHVAFYPDRVDAIEVDEQD